MGCIRCAAVAALLVLWLAAQPAAASQAEPVGPRIVIFDDPPAAAVVASWYGPGMWGNRTACGQTLTADLEGVAHRTLPCGSLVTLRYGSTTVVVPVVDRGPFNYTREFDLTYATKTALECRDLCNLFWMH